MTSPCGWPSAPGAWTWAYHVFSQVLGLDGALADPGHVALATATALYATALSKVSPAADLRHQWQRVATVAARHPDPAVAEWLTCRANLLAHPQDIRHWVQAMSRATELLEGGADDRRRAIWLADTTLAAAGRALDLTRGEPTDFRRGPRSPAGDSRCHVRAAGDGGGYRFAGPGMLLLTTPRSTRRRCSPALSAPKRPRARHWPPTSICPEPPWTRPCRTGGNHGWGCAGATCVTGFGSKSLSPTCPACRKIPSPATTG